MAIKSALDVREQCYHQATKCCQHSKCRAIAVAFNKQNYKIEITIPHADCKHKILAVISENIFDDLRRDAELCKYIDWFEREIIIQ